MAVYFDSKAVVLDPVFNIAAARIAAQNAGGALPRLVLKAWV